MLVDNENEAKSSTSNMIIGAVIIITAILIFAMASGGGGRDDKDCIEWGVIVDNHGKESWAPIPYTPKTREDAEYIAKNLETQDQGGRYYTARCKEYKK